MLHESNGLLAGVFAWVGGNRLKIPNVRVRYIRGNIERSPEFFVLAPEFFVLAPEEFATLSIRVFSKGFVMLFGR